MQACFNKGAEEIHIFTTLRCQEEENQMLLIVITTHISYACLGLTSWEVIRRT